MDIELQPVASSRFIVPKGEIMAEGELNVDSVITRLLDGKQRLIYHFYINNFLTLKPLFCFQLEVDRERVFS